MTLTSQQTTHPGADIEEVHLFTAPGLVELSLYMV
jgi:hypothetical protein